MILQSLVQHYEMLADKGKVTKPGWCSAKVSYAIRLGIDGTVLGIVDLRQEETRGKKTVMVPANLEVPQMVSRSSGVLPNFLCDNSKYLLGIDKEGSSGRVRECFEAAKELHIKYLQDVHNETATAVKKFFQKWNPDKARECQEINKIWDEITSGGNLIFMLMVQYVQDDDEIRSMFQETFNYLEQVFRNPSVRKIAHEFAQHLKDSRRLSHYEVKQLLGMISED